MTISPHEPNQQAQVPAQTSDYDGYDGLGEFGVEDMVTPRISIVHRDGLFKDSLTNQTYGSLNLIILGLVKQRILWPERMNEGDMPMCRSNDHKTGFVNLTLGNKPADKQFPWHKSNFDPNQQTLDAEGRLQLPCDSCELKEWGSHPDGQKPWCAELYTLPVMYDPMSSGEYVPALVSFQKTQLKPLRAYLSAFQRMGTPPFQVFTTVTLTVNQFGQNPFSVPNFAMGQQTDPGRWVEYAQNYRSMQGFLRTPPRAEEQQAAQPAPSNNAWGQQPLPTEQNPWGQAAPAGQPAWGQQPVQQPQTIPAQVNQPPAQQPVQQPQFQQPAAAQQPVQQPAPVAQQPVQQAPPVQQQPVQQAPAQQPPAQFAPPPFEQAATPEPAPEPAAQAAPQEPAAAPVTDPSGIVGGWAAQVGGAPQEAAPQTPQGVDDGTAQPVEQQAPVQQAPVEQQPVQQAPQQGQAPGGAKLPF